VLIPYACRIFKNTLPVSLGVFPHEVNSRSPHACRLKNLPAFASLFSQVEAVKPQPTFSLPGSSDIERLSPSKFLAPSAQSFELRFWCEPAGFRNQTVIRRLIPCTQSAIFRLLPFARPSASSFSATGHVPTFIVCDRPLLDWNSRPYLASEPALRLALLRQNCGFQPTFQASTSFRRFPL